MNYETLLSQSQRGQAHGVTANEQRERLPKAEREAADAERAAWLAQLNADAEAKHKAEREAHEAEQNRVKEERNAAKEATAKAQALALWEGSKEAFDRQWPAMYERQLAQETVERMDQARRNHAAIYKGAF